MNEIRGKFIDELGDQLELSEIADSEIILEDYIVAYDDKLNKGMTDMEIIISLGDPADIVKALKKKPHMTEEERKAFISEGLRSTVSDLISTKKTDIKPIDKKANTKTKKKKDKKAESKIALEIKKPEIAAVKIVPNKNKVQGEKKDIFTLNKKTVEIRSAKSPIILTELKPEIKSLSQEPLPARNNEVIPAIKPEILPEEKPVENIDVIEAPIVEQIIPSPVKPEKSKKKAAKNNNKKKKAKRKKHRYFLKLIIFLIIVITSIIIPIGFLYSGLVFLLDGSLISKLETAGICFGATLIILFINISLRKIIKNMVIRNQ